ncbi:hypothetical protein [Salinibius halmophilus]|uniref:hypothetical protein n=1 Tax=Salinibius halmophilus TaxID=1853216 RepID=UPI000E675148|nr:hypothetical protein [Salinibius halmophilus]
MAEWSDWFKKSLREIDRDGDGDQLSHILALSSVRELWIQGELYLRSNDVQGLTVNHDFETHKSFGDSVKVDLLAEPTSAAWAPMLCEVKVITNDFQGKVVGYWQKDIERLYYAIGKQYERYFLAVVGNFNRNTPDWSQTPDEQDKTVQKCIQTLHDEQKQLKISAIETFKIRPSEPGKPAWVEGILCRVNSA